MVILRINFGARLETIELDTGSFSAFAEPEAHWHQLSDHNRLRFHNSRHRGRAGKDGG